MSDELSEGQLGQEMQRGHEAAQLLDHPLMVQFFDETGFQLSVRFSGGNLKVDYLSGI